MLDSSRQNITRQVLLDEFFSCSQIHLISVVSPYPLKSERNTEHFLEVAGIYIDEMPYTSEGGRGETRVLKWQQVAKCVFLFCHFQNGIFPAHCIQLL